MVIKKEEGTYRDEYGKVVTPLTMIYATTAEIEKGIPTTGLEAAFLFNTENADIYSLSMNGPLKKWNKI